MSIVYHGVRELLAGFIIRRFVSWSKIVIIFSKQRTATATRGHAYHSFDYSLHVCIYQ